MFTVDHVVEVIAEKCIGCKACDRVCPTEAILTIEKLAHVIEEKCTGCNKCIEACLDHGAIKRKFFDEADYVVLSNDVEKHAPEQIDALCKRAHVFPEDSICPCTGTTAGEVAAAILDGCDNMTAISLETGVRGVCSMWCTTVVARLMQAAGLDLPTDNSRDWRLYAQGAGDDLSLWNIDEDIVNQYPEYRLAKSREHLNNSAHDNPAFPRVRGSK